MTNPVLLSSEVKVLIVAQLGQHFLITYRIAHNVDGGGGGSFDVLDAFKLDCQNSTRQIV